MKKYLFTILIFLSFLLISCQKELEYDIVTTTYFQHDIVKNIVKDKMTVDVLTKPGIDNHDFMPSSKQMANIKNSKLFTFTSYEVDHWLNENVNQLVGSETIVVNLNDFNNLEINDLHYWTDPVLIMDFIAVIKDEIIKIDPSNKAFYESNATSYLNSINEVHLAMTAYFNSKENISIYFAGHNAMHYFEERYNITITALSNTNKPDADLTSTQITTLLETIKTNQIHYLFTEELKEPKVAITIKNELAKENYELTLLELHGYHNVSKEDFDNNVTYLDLLNSNFENIKLALGE